MATTTNNKLFKYTNDNDLGDLKLLADTMDTIDKGISLKYSATLTAENTYTVTTGLSKTSLNNDYSLKVKIPSSSSGAVKIVIDSCSAVPVMKATSSGLTAVKNFKAKGIYELVYEDGNFICASGDNLEEVTVTSGKLLENETANDSEGNVIKGSIAVKSKASATLAAGQSISYQPGYYGETIDVSAKDLASQTQATADATKILDGYNAIVNGQRIDGTIPNRGEYQYSNEVGTGSNYVSFRKIPYGYYPSSSEDSFPEIRANFNIIAPVIGLTANKIVSGNIICGVAGAATIQSLGGFTFATGTVACKESDEAFSKQGSSPYKQPIAEITGLSFKPKYGFAFRYASNIINVSFFDNNRFFSNVSNTKYVYELTDSINGTYLVGDGYIRFPLSSSDEKAKTYNYCIFG